MKVTFETINTKPQITNKKTSIKNTNQVQQNQNQTSLPSFHTPGMSLVSFKGEDIDIEKLEKTKKELTDQKKAAEAQLKKADNWDYTREHNRASANAEAEISRNNLSWYNWSKKSRIRDKWMNDFYSRNNEIRDNNNRRKDLENIIKTCDTALKDSDNQIAIGIRLNNLNEAQRAVNKMYNAKGGLQERIAGYGAEKSKIERMFVMPLAKSLENPDVKIPSAILLHGATGTGKTTFLDAIAEQSAGYVVVDDMTEEKDSEVLVKDFYNKLRVARRRFLGKDDVKSPYGTRTILLINEAEKILAMTPEYAEENLDYSLDESDKKLLRKYDEDTNLVDNVNFFKGFLDHCSQAPADENDIQRGGLTVFITTNYPHLIHPDLLTRDGKLPYIAINPAEDSNIEAVVKHYAKLNSEALKGAKSVENIEHIDTLIGLTDKAKATLKEYKKNGNLDKLYINYDAIPYDKIAAMFKPTKQLGAYSNDRYRKVSEDAFQNYLENPETPYYTHFLKVLMREKRDIGPKRYNKFNEIYKLLAPLEIGEREELIRLEKMNALDEKYKARLEYIRMLEESDKENLLAKQKLGQINDKELERLKEIEEYQRLDNMTFEEYMLQDVEPDDDEY